MAVTGSCHGLIRSIALAFTGRDRENDEDSQNSLTLAEILTQNLLNTNQPYSVISCIKFIAVVKDKIYR
jgi:hypothetical protein